MQYDNMIRKLIESENAIRNHRTSWFLVLQGLLVNGLIQTYIYKSDLANNFLYIAIQITVFGILSSISFLYASWRSEKSIQMILAC